MLRGSQAISFWVIIVNLKITGYALIPMLDCYVPSMRESCVFIVQSMHELLLVQSFGPPSQLLIVHMLCILHLFEFAHCKTGTVSNLIIQIRLSGTARKQAAQFYVVVAI